MSNNLNFKELENTISSIIDNENSDNEFFDGENSDDESSSGTVNNTGRLTKKSLGNSNFDLKKYIDQAISQGIENFKKSKRENPKEKTQKREYKKRESRNGKNFNDDVSETSERSNHSFKKPTDTKVILMDVTLPNGFQYRPLNRCPHIRNIKNFVDDEFVYHDNMPVLKDYKYYLSKDKTVYVVEDTILVKYIENGNPVEWNAVKHTKNKKYDREPNTWNIIKHPWIKKFYLQNDEFDGFELQNFDEVEDTQFYFKVERETEDGQNQKSIFYLQKKLFGVSFLGEDHILYEVDETNKLIPLVINGHVQKWRWAPKN